MEDNHSPVMKPHKILQKGKPQSFFILSFYASVSLKLDLTNEHTASL